MNTMTPEAFVYWLRGYVELHGEKPSDQQWEAIKGHLDLCFDQVIPEIKHVKVPTFDHKEKQHKPSGWHRKNESGDRRMC